MLHFSASNSSIKLLGKIEQIKKLGALGRSSADQLQIWCGRKRIIIDTASERGVVERDAVEGLAEAI